MARFDDVKRLLLAALLGAAGNSAVNVAIPWLVLDVSGSSTSAGLVLGISGLSIIVASPLAGGLVNLLGARRLSVGADALSTASVLLFPLASLLGWLNMPVMILAATLGAAFDPAGFTARKSMITGVVERHGRSLEQVNGRYESAVAVGTIVGPAAAAGVIAVAGVEATFVVIAGVLAATAVLVATMPDDRPGTRRASSEQGASDDGAVAALRQVVGEARDGVRAMRADRPLWTFTLMFTVLAALYLPVELVVLSRHFNETGRPEVLGLVLSAASLGVVIGALGFERVLTRVRPDRLVVGSLTFIGAIVVAMAALPGAVLFALLGFVLGLVFGPVSPLATLAVQRRMPEHLHGPVFGAQLSLNHVALPLGTMVLGALTDRFAASSILVVVGVAFMATTLAVGATGRLRGLDVSA